MRNNYISHLSQKWECYAAGFIGKFVICGKVRFMVCPESKSNPNGFSLLLQLFRIFRSHKNYFAQKRTILATMSFLEICKKFTTNLSNEENSFYVYACSWSRTACYLISESKCKCELLWTKSIPKMNNISN